MSSNPGDSAATCDGYEWRGDVPWKCQLPPGHKAPDGTFLGRSCKGNPEPGDTAAPLRDLYEPCNEQDRGGYCRAPIGHDGDHFILRDHKCCDCPKQPTPLPCCNLGHDTGWVTLDGYAAHDPAVTRA